MITAKLLRDWSVCWSADRISSHLAGRSGISPREVAADETIDLKDRLWVLCRALEYRNESAARTYAIDSAAGVSHLAGNESDQAEHARLVADLRRIYALPVAGRWRWLVAWGDVWFAAKDAAGDAAKDAAGDAAKDAAWDSAGEAAAVAAGNAAWTAAERAVAAGGIAWDTAMDFNLRKAIDRALVALGSDADGWVS